MQRAVRLGEVLAAFALGALLLAAHAAFVGLPNRSELGPSAAVLDLGPVRIAAPPDSGFQVAAAWRVTSKDPRFGGISGLAVDRTNLVAITDAGVVVRFKKPGRDASSVRAHIAELPSGPGSAEFKSGRDSEAIAADPAGRGWWLAFERRDELWLFDPNFRRPLRRLVVRGQPWPPNRGVEGLIAAGPQLHLFPEGGGTVLTVRNGRARAIPLHGIGGPYPWSGWVSDAARLDDGRLMLVERRLSAAGFTNALLLLERVGAGYGVARRIALPLARTDNLEAVAVDSGRSGATRLWLMTDNDHRPFADTLLMAIDLPAGP